MLANSVVRFRGCLAFLTDSILSGWAIGLSGRNPKFAAKEEERYQAALVLIEAGGDPHFAPEGHPPPVVVAEGIGGAIGRLYSGKPTHPERERR